VVLVDQPVSSQTLQRRWRQRAWLGVGALVGVVLLIWGVNRVLSPSVALSEIRVAEIRRGDIVDTVNASGVVVPLREQQVASPVDTRVAKVHAKAGQVVAKGDLLVTLDDHTVRLAIESLSEQMAQQDNLIEGQTLDLARTLKTLNSEIELLQLDLQSARVKHERFKTLGAKGITSSADVMAAQLTVQRTEIQLRQLRESIIDTRRATASRITGAKLQQSIYAKQLAQQRLLLERTEVRAPFAGMLSWLLADEGSSVAAGQMVAKVSGLSQFRVEASVSDFYARYLSPGQAVRVVYSGQELPGSVYLLLPESQDGTVKLLVDLAQPDHPLLRNKLRVEAHIVTAAQSNTLVVATGPAINGRGRQSLFVLNDGVAQKRVLDMGLSDGQSHQILSGAKAGERLIVSDTTRFNHLNQFRISE
jgi:HlyD family secretion protein